MRIAVLLVSRNRPDLVERQIEALARIKVAKDVYVVEMGTSPDRMTRWSNISYRDDDFRGKCFGHNVALNFARQAASYDYFLVLMNDVFMEFDGDPVAHMIGYMDRHPNVGLISPSNVDAYPGSARTGQGGLRPATTCDYLCFLIRAELVERVGFLNPDFKYCWGAIHELSVKLYRAGYYVAYLDDFDYTHLGGTTYGAAGTGTITRSDYQIRAAQFAHDYFLTNYGATWHQDFWEATWNHPIRHNTFLLHRRFWRDAFPAEHPARRSPPPVDDRMRPDLARLTEGDGLRLHLGSGHRYREGWTNIDINQAAGPDIVGSVVDLAMFEAGTVDLIEGNHLFEHLTEAEAERALAEYRRVLRPGGVLLLELPNADRSRQMLGAPVGSAEHQLARIGLWGWREDIEAEGIPQMHKSGWTPTSLGLLAKAAGFAATFTVPVTQTWRPAYRFRRDMRICAVR